MLLKALYSFTLLNMIFTLEGNLNKLEASLRQGNKCLLILLPNCAGYLPQDL
jgi:hypothetical protein